MKQNIRKTLTNFLIASSLLFLLGGNALAAEPGKIPDIGNVSGPATTTDITKDLGIFADMGRFILEYSVHIAIFVMVLTVVVLAVRGS